MTTKKLYKCSDLYKTDQIDGINWETQFDQNGTVRFILLEFEIHENAGLNKKMISLEERVDQDWEFTRFE